MAEAGADLIEIGIPFSDPIAEGPVIQEADIRALAAGTTTDGIFEMVRSVRKKVPCSSGLYDLSESRLSLRHGKVLPPVRGVWHRAG